MGTDSVKPYLGYKYNYEVVKTLIVTNGYKSKSEWHRGSQSSYQAAKKGEFFDKIVQELNLTSDRKRTVSKWDNKQRISTELQKLSTNTYTELTYKCRGLLRYAKKNKEVDELVNRNGIKPSQRRKDIASVDSLAASLISKGIRSTAQWAKYDGYSHSLAKKRGWIQEVTSLAKLELSIKPKTSSELYKTKEDVIKAASRLNVSSRSHWGIVDSRSLHAATKLGIVNEVLVDLIRRYKPENRVYALLVVKKGVRPIVGFGRTVCLKRRLMEYRRDAKKEGASVLLLKSLEVENEGKARSFELEVLMTTDRTDCAVKSLIVESSPLEQVKIIYDCMERIRLA